MAALGFFFTGDSNFCRGSPVDCCADSAHVVGHFYFRSDGTKMQTSLPTRTKKSETAYAVSDFFFQVGGSNFDVLRAQQAPAVGKAPKRRRWRMQRGAFGAAVEKIEQRKMR